MAGWWTHPRTTRSERYLYLSLLALVLNVVGCSGPDNGSPSSTITSAEVPTAAATAPAPAVPSATRPSAVSTPSPTTGPDVRACTASVDLLDHTDVLDKVTYQGTVIGGLSAMARDGDSTTYYALSDRGGWVYTLDFPVPGVPTIITAFRLRDAAGEPDAIIDGEGLAGLPNGELLVSSEVEPSIRQYTSDGQYVARLSVPDRFLVQPGGHAIGNRAFESLAISPSGQHLFTAVEQPLDGDGTTDDNRGRIRILRYDLIGGTFQPTAEYLYLSEPDQGVSELIATSDTRLLVLERGVSLLSGFSARVFQVSLDGAEDVSKIDRLEETDARPAIKDLLVNVADCPIGDNAASGGINLLENFESMALGPRQFDGRHTLLIGSDDNFQTFQVTRFLVFAIDPNRF